MSKIEFYILDSVVDSDMPFESVDNTVKEIDPKLSPKDTVNALFKLYGLGFITIRQIPIKAFDQEFKEKSIQPDKPIDILGELKEFFNEYCDKRDYLWKAKLGNSESGVPFGIWIDLTADGKEEWNLDIYKQYYE